MKKVWTTTLLVFASPVLHAFSSPKTLGGRRRRRVWGSYDDSHRNRGTTTPLRLSSREEALAADIEADGNLATSPSGLLASIPTPAKGAALAIPILLVLLSLDASAFASKYSELLNQYALPVKSLTSGALCGISDIIAI